MFRRRKQKKNKKFTEVDGIGKKPGRFDLPDEIKQWVWGVLMILTAIIISLSFFEKAGRAGEIFMKGARFSIGETVFLIPLILILGGIIFLGAKANLIFKKEKKILWPVMLAILILISGLTGILSIFNSQTKKGGWIGYILSWPFLKYFGFWATIIIFFALIIIGGVIFWQFLRFPRRKKDEAFKPVIPKIEVLPRPSIIKKIFAPRFKVKEISPFTSQEEKQTKKQSFSLNLETKPISGNKTFSYQPPPLNLLDSDRGVPNSGDTRVNSAIIKKSLQNFGIDVIMSEVNIGPTVTQYTLKPAEGIKLSKIIGLSNDLALALASHPIRIEAPIPGRSLVGVEVPNETRTQVRLRNLIENSNFQEATSNLMIALGRDVAGVPIYADLTKMPHLLVAGSTGTGKTIFLNSLILSLLYQSSTTAKSAGPENLRLILVDPKRVEFPVYSNLPHLLCPVIYDATQTVNALKWLIGEMERRFDVLAEAGARDIKVYNERALKNEEDILPFIVVIIDELADLMAAKGREVETEIVRLAQMARAVGIHLVVATQRPSVEVITGLIKANITSRITFQVASQVDSRTVLDVAGAEKLLGSGDLLYISAQTVKPKRIQGSYISEKEVKKVVNHILSKNENGETKTEMNDDLVRMLTEGANKTETNSGGVYGGDEDSLYEEAKRMVIEAKKASASLLQRRLRVGYARAARLIDILEERGVVGPGEGAKPREVYGDAEVVSESVEQDLEEIENPDDEENWQKI